MFYKVPKSIDVLKINQHYLQQPSSTEVSTTRSTSTWVSQHYRRLEACRGNYLCFLLFKINTLFIFHHYKELKWFNNESTMLINFWFRTRNLKMSLRHFTVLQLNCKDAHSKEYLLKDSFNFWFNQLENIFKLCKTA